MDSFKSWWSQPYREGMNVQGWFLFLGLLGCLSALWGIILSHLKGVVEV